MGDSTKSNPKKAYLFLHDAEFDLKLGVLHIPGMYWASDKDGRKRWSPEELEDYLDYWDLSPDDLRLHVYGESCSLSPHHYDALRTIHIGCGFDPDSDDVAKALGYPILEFNPLYGTFPDGMFGEISCSMHYSHTDCS